VCVLLCPYVSSLSSSLESFLSCFGLSQDNSLYEIHTT